MSKFDQVKAAGEQYAAERPQEPVTERPKPLFDSGKCVRCGKPHKWEFTVSRPLCPKCIAGSVEDL